MTDLQKHCKSLPQSAKNFEFVLTKKWKIRISLKFIFCRSRSFLSPKLGLINLVLLKDKCYNCKNFLCSNIFTDLHPHLKKKSRILKFVPKISLNFGISDVDIWQKFWMIGQKVQAKIFFIPIFWPKKIWVFNHYKVSNIKNHTPSNALEGGVSVVLVTDPTAKSPPTKDGRFGLKFSDHRAHPMRGTLSPIGALQVADPTLWQGPPRPSLGGLCCSNGMFFW